MLFRKLENFGSGSIVANCLIKYTSQNATFVFEKDVLGLWYIFHLNDCTIYDDAISVNASSKLVVQTDSNGASDGFIDARTDEKTITVSGKAIILLVGARPLFGALVVGGCSSTLRIDSSQPIYSNIRDIPVLGKPDNASHIDLSKHIATMLNAYLSENLNVGSLSSFPIIAEPKSGIKSGQFIL